MGRLPCTVQVGLLRPCEREAEGQEYRGRQLLAQNVAHFIKDIHRAHSVLGSAQPGKGCATPTRESSGSAQVTGGRRRMGLLLLSHHHLVLFLSMQGSLCASHFSFQKQSHILILRDNNG